MAFASGKYALAICDRCGFRVKYSAMREEWNGSRVCPECFETKHPQLDPPFARADAEALRDARPDVAESPMSAADVATYNDFINGLP